MRSLFSAAILALSAFCAHAAPSGTLPAGHVVCFDDYAQRDLNLAIQQKDQRMVNHLFKNKKCGRLAQAVDYNELDYDQYYFYYKVRIWFGDDPVVVFTTLPKSN